MRKHDTPDRVASPSVPDFGELVSATPKRPEWPVGLPLSKPEKLSCFLPDDLKVILTAEAFQQLFAYAYATASEISCMGVVRREANTFIIERFHLVKQEGGMAHTEMDPNALGELVEQLMAGDKMQDAQALKCWAHSHPGMGVFWSKTDDTTCRLLASDYLVSLVVSDGFAIRARVDTAGPLAFSVDNVPVLCQVSADKARIEQYEKEVAEKVKPASIFLFGKQDRQSELAATAGDEPFSEYFGGAYSLFGDEDTAELEAVPEDSDML